MRGWWLRHGRGAWAVGVAGPVVVGVVLAVVSARARGHETEHPRGHNPHTLTFYLPTGDNLAQEVALCEAVGSVSLELGPRGKKTEYDGEVSYTGEAVMSMAPGSGAIIRWTEYGPEGYGWHDFLVIVTPETSERVRAELERRAKELAIEQAKEVDLDMEPVSVHVVEIEGNCALREDRITCDGRAVPEREITPEEEMARIAEEQARRRREEMRRRREERERELEARRRRAEEARARFVDEVAGAAEAARRVFAERGIRVAVCAYREDGKLKLWVKMPWIEDYGRWKAIWPGVRERMKALGFRPVGYREFVREFAWPEDIYAFEWESRSKVKDEVADAIRARGVPVVNSLSGLRRCLRV